MTVIYVVDDYLIMSAPAVPLECPVSVSVVVMVDAVTGVGGRGGDAVGVCAGEALVCVLCACVAKSTLLYDYAIARRFILHADRRLLLACLLITWVGSHSSRARYLMALYLTLRDSDRPPRAGQCRVTRRRLRRGHRE